MNIGKAIRLLKVEPLKIPVPRKSRQVEPAVAPVVTPHEVRATVRR
jgi:hypothetical protein